MRDQRYVADGNVASSQRVSADIDMVLSLLGQIRSPELHPGRPRTAVRGHPNSPFPQPLAAPSQIFDRTEAPHIGTCGHRARRHPLRSNVGEWRGDEGPFGDARVRDGQLLGVDACVIVE